MLSFWHVSNSTSSNCINTQLIIVARCITKDFNVWKLSINELLKYESFVKFNIQIKLNTIFIFRNFFIIVTYNSSSIIARWEKSIQELIKCIFYLMEIVKLNAITILTIEFPHTYGVEINCNQNVSFNFITTYICIMCNMFLMILFLHCE